jgi:hypothetical protein
LNLASLLRALWLAGLCVLQPAAAQLHAFPGRLDVPFVPTNHATVEAMLQIANVGPGDYLIDLGSGDGRIPVAAARLRGARAFGVDLDPQRVREGAERARAAGVADRVRFEQANLFDVALGEATVVTMYLLPRVNLDLRPRLFAQLRPGARVVSHDFDMGEWKPDLRASVRGAGSEIYFWIMPAQAAGRWRLELAQSGAEPYEIEFTQKFQELEGTARRAGRPVLLRDPYLQGERLSFTVIDDADYLHRLRFEGRIAGDAIEGTVRGEGTAPRAQHAWRARRLPP